MQIGDEMEIQKGFTHPAVSKAKQKKPLQCSTLQGLVLINCYCFFVGQDKKLFMCFPSFFFNRLGSMFGCLGGIMDGLLTGLDRLVGQVGSSIF